MTGGAGNDTYIVDNTGDRVTEKAKGGTDLVKASVNWTLGSQVENLTLTGSKALKGTGNSLANAIAGNGGNNVLDGMGGADRLSGGSLKVSPRVEQKAMRKRYAERHNRG